MALNTPILKFQLESTLTGTVGLSTVTAPTAVEWNMPLTTGTAAGMADKIYTGTVTLAGSATSALDLAASLTDALGATITFARIKLVAIRAATTNNAANAMQVTRTATTGALLFMADGDGISLNAGEFFVWASNTAAGKVVTDTSDDTLTFTNSAGTNTISCDVIIIGASA